MEECMACGGNQSDHTMSHISDALKSLFKAINVEALRDDEFGVAESLKQPYNAIKEVQRRIEEGEL